MKKVATFGGYDYYVGTAKDGKEFYNLVPSGNTAPTGGYFDSGYICRIKKVPNLFAI